MADVWRPIRCSAWRLRSFARGPSAWISRLSVQGGPEAPHS